MATIAQVAQRLRTAHLAPGQETGNNGIRKLQLKLIFLLSFLAHVHWHVHTSF